MKKLFTTLLLLAAMLLPMLVSAQGEPAAEAKGPAVEGRKEVNADQMIARIESRKVKTLENIKARFEKLNEKLAQLETRIGKASSRIQKQKQKSGDAKVEANGSEKPTMSDEKLNERKTKATERYNNFKKNIETRRDEIAKRLEENKGKSERLDKLSPEDRDRVTAAREKMRAEVKAEVTKLADEALKRLEATYQKIMSL